MVGLQAIQTGVQNSVQNAQPRMAGLFIHNYVRMVTDPGVVVRVPSTDIILGDYKHIKFVGSDEPTPFQNDGVVFTNTVEGKLEVLDKDNAVVADLTREARDRLLFDQVDRTNLGIFTAARKLIDGATRDFWEGKVFDVFQSVRTLLNGSEQNGASKKQWHDHDGLPGFYRYWGSPAVVDRKSNDNYVVKEQWLKAFGFEPEAETVNTRNNRQLGLDNLKCDVLLQRTPTGQPVFYHSGQALRSDFTSDASGGVHDLAGRNSVGRHHTLESQHPASN